MKKKNNNKCFHANSSWFDKPSISEQDRRVLLNRIAGQMGIPTAGALSYMAPLFSQN